MSAVTVTKRGPLFSSAARRIVEAEFAAAGTVALGLVVTRANRTVHRDQGIYGRSWQPARHEFGSGDSIVRSSRQNTAPHAGVEENGRRPGFYVPITPLVAWVTRKGIATAERAVGVAIAISKRHYRLGWPNLGSYQGGGYLGPPKPAEVGLEREARGIDAAYETAARRIARRLN